MATSTPVEQPEHSGYPDREHKSREIEDPGIIQRPIIAKEDQRGDRPAEGHQRTDREINPPCGNNQRHAHGHDDYR
jgi:hypothetical protein